MYYKNAKIYTQDFRFQAGAFSVENGRFAEILPESVPVFPVFRPSGLPLLSQYTWPGTKNRSQSPGELRPVSVRNRCHM